MIGESIAALRERGWTIQTRNGPGHNVICPFCGYQPKGEGLYYYNREKFLSSDAEVPDRVPICDMCDRVVGEVEGLGTDGETDDPITGLPASPLEKVRANRFVREEDFSGSFKSVEDRQALQLRWETDEGQQLIHHLLTTRQAEAGADFRYISFKNKLLNGADLSGVDFSHARFEGVNLAGARLARANLDGTLWLDVTATDCDLTGASFIDAMIRRTDLTRATLARSRWVDAQLTDSCCAGTNFSYAIIKETLVQNCDMAGANLRGTGMDDAASKENSSDSPDAAYVAVQRLMPHKRKKALLAFHAMLADEAEKTLDVRHPDFVEWVKEAKLQATLWLRLRENVLNIPEEIRNNPVASLHYAQGINLRDEENDRKRLRRSSVHARMAHLFHLYMRFSGEIQPEVQNLAEGITFFYSVSFFRDADEYPWVERLAKIGAEKVEGYPDQGREMHFDHLVACVEAAVHGGDRNWGLTCAGKALEYRDDAPTYWQIRRIFFLMDYSRLLLAENLPQDALRIAQWACDEAENEDEAGITRNHLQETRQKILGYQPEEEIPNHVPEALKEMECFVGKITKKVENGGEINVIASMKNIIQHSARLRGHNDIDGYLDACAKDFTQDCVDLLLYVMSTDDRESLDRLTPGLHRYIEEIREQNNVESFRVELLAMALSLTMGEKDPLVEWKNLLQRLSGANLGWQGTAAFEMLIKVLLRLSPSMLSAIRADVAACFQSFLQELENMEVDDSPEAIRQDLAVSFSTVETVGLGLLEIGHGILPSLVGILEQIKGGGRTSPDDPGERTCWFRLSRRLFATLHNLYGQMVRTMAYSADHAATVTVWRESLVRHALAEEWYNFDQVRKSLGMDQYVSHQTQKHRLFPAVLADIHGYPCLHLFRAWHTIAPEDETGTLIYLHDNLDGQEHVQTTTLSSELTVLLHKAISPGGKLDQDKLKTLSAILVPPELSERLPEYFGIRAGGLIHSVPWLMLPLVDGHPLGERSLPILFTQREIDLKPLLDPLIHPRILAVGDAVYQPGDVNDGLVGEQCLHPKSLAKVPFQEALTAWHTTNDTHSENMARGRFSPLLASRVEVMAIHSLFPATTTLTMGREAYRQRILDLLQREKPDILHVAVHGNAMDGIEDSGYLALSVINDHGQQVTGGIGFHDIVGLNLKGVRLVVLSACKTLRGQHKEGEGMLSLAWAFLAAGVQGVVAGRWEVGDRYSLLFWQSFYQCLQKGQGIIHSLKNTQRQFMQHPDFSDKPMLWGAYQLVV